jgi:hypothetical protein
LFSTYVEKGFLVKTHGLEEKAKDALANCLRDVPFLQLALVSSSPNPDEFTPDLFASLETENRSLHLIGEIKNNGQPRYARQAVNQLLRYLETVPDAYGIFIAPYISKQAAKICQDANIGFVDFAGNGHLSFLQVYIHKEGYPNPFSERRDLLSLYSPKAERILRVLLVSGPKEWRVTELAAEAEVSLGLVSNVKKLLTDREWVDAQPIGFSLTRPLELLDQWSENYTYRRNRIAEYYTLLDIPDFEYRLGEVCAQENIRYSLTGFSGAARLAAMVRYQRVMAYIQGDFERLKLDLEMKPVSTGANVLLLTPYDEGVFYGSMDVADLQIASPVQAYLDLISYRGRGEEAAQALREIVINKIWS